ncbi:MULTISPECIES: single-stranded DNA-binding protein [Cysteiniphilum]|uniref:Single-stranded DNA-binding protein n=1 Tax=Cysteiniphilum litorale TaxID=2056700 RepID=A0A8J3E8Y2_9GAMM|nr:MULTISPECIES: single-stranded DNA-binding protein [Cysteiniphilum]GGF99310.1 single-stranded DNA-binding protein 1 [Cysteiniphilum litorale]
MAKGTVNEVTLLGRLGANAEVRYMQNGTSVANLRVATNDGYKDRQTGQFIENTEWHRVVFFGKLADTIAQYTTKGSLIYVKGRLRTNQWQDQNGQTHYTTEVVGISFQLVGGNPQQNTQAQQQGQQPSNAPQVNNGTNSPASNATTEQEQPPVPSYEEYAKQLDDSDEVPF